MNYTVYLSSTLKDLEPEREAVRQALSDKCVVKNSYSSSEHDLVGSCLQDVERCDAYILILGLRYGYVPQREFDNPRGLSITQLEYEHAKNKPRFVFIKDEEAIPITQTDLKTRENAPDRIDNFRKQAALDQRCALFKTPDDLKLAVVNAFNGFKETREGSSASPAAWPRQVLENLSAKLNSEFDAHMCARDVVSPEQARARYIQAVLKLRQRPDSASKPPETAALPSEGSLQDYLAVDGMQLLVIGAGGGGKTTMLRQLAAAGARRALEDPRAPVFVYLRLAAFDRDGGFDLLLDRLTIAAQLQPEQFRTLWREARRPVAFLLDGLNEVGKTWQPSGTQALQTLLQNSPPQHRFVITSRPGSELEASCTRAVDSQRLRVADIAEFGERQVRAYLEAHGHPELQSRISGQLRDLASNPFLLWAITRTIGAGQDQGLRNRGSLFAALIDRYIFEERERGKPQPRPTMYNYPYVKKPVLARLALKMTEDGVTAVTDGPETMTPIALELKTLLREQEERGELPIEPEVFMPAKPAAASFLAEVVDNGVLVREGSALRFMHECIQEYFTAVALDTYTLEKLNAWAPRLRLARLDARGPRFESLVTWAGRAPQDTVSALVRCLRDNHPLLAAHLALEAGLPEQELRELREQFLSFTRSDHEQRRKLGAMGLAILPADDPEIVARLIELLDDDYEIHASVEQGLKAAPGKNVFSVLVNRALAASEDQRSKAAELLRQLVVEHSRPLSDILVQAWTAPDAQQDRVARLAALLDAKKSYETARRSFVREALLTLAVEAELAGDLEQTAALDALRRQAAQTPVKIGGLSSFASTIRDLAKRRIALDKQRDTLKFEYSGKDDAALEAIVLTGEGVERTAALDVLVERQSPGAIAPLVEHLLIRPEKPDWDRLDSVPRDAVQRHIAARLAGLDGVRLERARMVHALLSDRVERATLEQAFQNGNAHFRLFAARAAVRAGADGVAFLMEQLDGEADSRVREACVKALAESVEPAAIERLLDLLFDPAEPYDPTLIHTALTAAGATESILERLARQLRSQSPAHCAAAIREADRLLPDPRAAELLRTVTAARDPERLAQRSLARHGDAAAWRIFLQHALDTPAAALSVREIVDNRSTEPDVTDPFIAAARSVLHPALAGPDSARSAVALRLTCELSAWVDGAWRADSLAVAESLLRSAEPANRTVAVSVVRRFAHNPDSRLFDILLADRDKDVVQTAYRQLGDGAASVLQQRLRSAVESADAATAQRVAGVIADVVSSYSKETKETRDALANWLDSSAPEQFVTALSALAVLRPQYAEEDEWGELSRRAAGAFLRLGPEDTWRRFAESARSLPEEHREFIYAVLRSLVMEPEVPLSLFTAAAETWPHDLEIGGACCWADIHRGNPDRAGTRLKALEQEFPGRISATWLADTYAKLQQPGEALEHYSRVFDTDPTNVDVALNAGWYAFLAGDLDRSIELTGRALKLRPVHVMGWFNLGLAQLASGDTDAADRSYRRALAYTKRLPPTEAGSILDAVLGDLRLLSGPDEPVERIRSLLVQASGCSA